MSRRLLALLLLITLLVATGAWLSLGSTHGSSPSVSTSNDEPNRALLAEPALRGQPSTDNAESADPNLKSRSILVQVLDATLAPRAGARVFVETRQFWHSRRVPVDGWSDERGRTNANGELQIRLEPGEEVVGVFDPHDSASSIAPCGDSSCRFILPRRPELRVYVQTERGQPVGDAQLLVTIYSSHGSRVERHATSDASGAAAFLLPHGASAIVQGYHAEFGFSKEPVAVDASTKTLVLRGAHPMAFRLSGAVPTNGVDVYCVVREGGSVLWKRHVRANAGALVSVGPVSTGAHVTVLALGSDGLAAHADWTAEPIEQELELYEAPVVRLDITSERATEYPVTMVLIPPTPYRTVWGAFDEIGDRLRTLVPDGSSEVSLRVPRLTDSGLWRVHATTQLFPMTTEPEQFALDPSVGGGEVQDVSVHLIDDLRVTIRGVVRSLDGDPVPYARVGTRNPSVRECQVVSDAGGAFAFDSARPFPLKVFIAADGFVPFSTILETREAAKEGLEATLTPSGHGSLHAVTVHVSDTDGKPVEGVLLEWRLSDDSVIGQPISSSERPQPRTYLPSGTAILRVTPTASEWMQVPDRSYVIERDESIELTLQRRRARGKVTVVVQDLLDDPSSHRVLLVGPQYLSQRLTEGSAEFNELIFGTYVASIVVGGAQLPLGSVVVDGDEAVVRRTLGSLQRLSVRILPEPSVAQCVVYLKSAVDGQVLAQSASAPGATVEWAVPHGAYEVDVFSDNRLGHVRIQTSHDSDTAADVAFAGEAGNAMLVLGIKGADVAVVSLRIEGPTKRLWKTAVRVEEATSRFLARGLAPGTYDVTASVGSGPPRTIRLDVAAGHTTESDRIDLSVGGD